jgi:RNA polymerase sigma-70 factor (ECF subfamily)
VLGVGAAAEDAAQETMVRALRHAHRCRTPERPHPWVRQIARNEALRIAQGGHDVRPLDEGLEVASAEPDRPRAIRLDLQRAVRDLNSDDRTLLWLHYWGDFSQAEAAHRLEMDETTVRVRLHRARHKLRKALEPEPDGS